MGAVAIDPWAQALSGPREAVTEYSRAWHGTSWERASRSRAALPRVRRDGVCPANFFQKTSNLYVYNIIAVSLKKIL